MIVLPTDVENRIRAAGFEPDDLEGVVLNIDDVRQAGFCAPGYVKWLEAHDLTVADVYEGRVTAEDVAMMADAYGLRVVIKALETRRNG